MKKMDKPVSGMLAAGTYDLVLTGKDIRGMGKTKECYSDRGDPTHYHKAQK